MNVRAVDSRGSGDIQRLTTGDSEVVAARCLVVVIRIASKLIGCAVIPPKMGTATSKKRGLSADKSGYLDYLIFHGSITAAIFNDFVRHQVLPHCGCSIDKAPRSVIVVDDARIRWNESW